ncbi:hypothetical protein KI688_008743 [Linnemannia hyalina]|uniref:Uncharacterized protein n=1 Tax=Linnemannia hyalina TaxID=64524 RepID=A0A9P8BXC5_9FUNG|nr:hypothetical protein KI688_008743 [Linnemannia hyalina]
MQALSLSSSTSSVPKEKNHTTLSTLPPQAPQPSPRCQNAFQIPEILLRILQFVPLWIHPPHTTPSTTFFDNENITFSPRNILSCSLVSKPWRNPSLDLLFFVHHSQHQRQIPKQLVLLQSHRYKVFVDSQDFWTREFRGLGNLTLGLGSTRRWESRAAPFQGGDRELELLSVEDLRLKLVCPSHEEDEDEDTETLDVVAFLPYLKRLRLDVFTRVDGKLLIANLHKARARAHLAATTAASGSNSSPALLLPLPSKLESLEIHVHQGTTLNPTDEDNQTLYLTFPEITTLIQEHAHLQGLTRLHLHLTTISPFLTSAIRAIPPSSPLGYNVLQDLEIRISDFYGHTCDPIPWIRSILATCTRLRRVYLDLVGPQAEQKVYMRFAQGLFCGEVEAEEGEAGGTGGVVDPRKAWGCAGSLEELTVLGIHLPVVVDMAGYLGWRYRKSESGRLKKAWRTNRQRLQGLFTRTLTSTSTSTSTSANANANANNGNRNTNSNEGKDDTSSSEEEEQQCSRKDRRISMTRVIAFEIYENLKSIGRDPDTVCPDDVTYFDRLLSFACPDYSPSSSSSCSSSLDSQQQQLQQQQRTRKQYKQKQKQKQTPPYRPSRAEMRFNAQLATQIAQCPRLIMLRLNWDTCTQELADLRARQKVLQLEQQEKELLREKIVALEGPSERTTKVQQQPRQSQKQEQNKRRSFLFG